MSGSDQRDADGEIAGAWTPVAYEMRDGTTHRASGLMTLAHGAWTTLFFVLDDDGDRVVRGLAQGGTYTLDGASLTLTHRYHLAAGHDVAGAPPADAAGVRVSSPAEARVESCTVRRDGSRLFLDLPSGNRVVFERWAGVAR